MFQELGGVRRLAEGDHRTVIETIAGKEYQLFLVNPKLSHRCVAVGVSLDCEFILKELHVHEFGIVVFGDMHGAPWLLVSLHFPHQQREDAVDAWEQGVSTLLAHLTGLRWQYNVIVGHDLNQDLHAEFDEFEGMMHYRECVFQSGLCASPPLGHTWHARGSSSAIDFFLYQLRGSDVSFSKREDLRFSLPSDHDAIVMSVRFRSSQAKRVRARPRRTLCGKWTVAGEALFQHLDALPQWDDASLTSAFRQHGVSTRSPTLRYKDPEPIKELIRRRKLCADADTRAAFMQEIHQARIQARAEHKEWLIKEARAGNCRAIAHMRSSAAGAQTEGSYIQRAGGFRKATEDLFHFYDSKFARVGAAISEEQIRTLSQRHARTPVASCTRKEILDCLKGSRSGVSAGPDGTTYEGFLHLLSRDTCDRIPLFFTRLLRGELELPASWKKGRIVLLPKTARPSGPKDLRPICLTPVLGRIFGKVLMRRVHAAAPPCSGHQIGCRKGVQVADGIMAAQSALQLLKQSRGRAFAAKVDIRAAFDSLDIGAVWRWLMECRPSSECERLFQLLYGTQVELTLGGLSHQVKLGKGLMQGTSYSADVFSRVVDFFLSPLHDLFDQKYEYWTCPDLGLPHFIVYADDVLVLADDPRSLQDKLQQIVDCLSVLGLQINHDKSRVMNSHDGWSPGVWLRHSSRPLTTEDSLQFLGVPLTHSPQPHTLISFLLRKTSSAYYGFKRIIDAGKSPLRVRLLIFNTFITAKWAWAAPLMLPNRTALRKLEAAKTTFLLSMLRVPTDPLLSWLDNRVSRRRAVKLTCRLANGPDWRYMVDKALGLFRALGEVVSATSDEKDFAKL